MSYGLKFELNVVEIFKFCGYSTSEALESWPVGATSEGVTRGQRLEINPVLAAIIHFCDVLLANFRAGRVTKLDVKENLNSLVRWTNSCHPRHTLMVLELKLISLKLIDNWNQKVD